MGYGNFAIQRDLAFQVRVGEIFVIMGESGCGKSTLLRHLIGLHAPIAGEVLYGETHFWRLDEVEHRR